MYGSPEERPVHEAWVADLARELSGGDPAAYAGFLGDEGEERHARRLPGRDLGAAGGGQGRVRPGQRLPDEPQRPAGGRLGGREARAQRVGDRRHHRRGNPPRRAQLGRVAASPLARREPRASPTTASRRRRSTAPRARARPHADPRTGAAHDRGLRDDTLDELRAVTARHDEVVQAAAPLDRDGAAIALGVDHGHARRADREMVDGAAAAEHHDTAPLELLRHLEVAARRDDRRGAAQHQPTRECRHEESCRSAPPPA